MNITAKLNLAEQVSIAISKLPDADKAIVLAFAEGMVYKMEQIVTTIKHDPPAASQ